MLYYYINPQLVDECNLFGTIFYNNINNTQTVRFYTETMCVDSESNFSSIKDIPLITAIHANADDTVYLVKSLCRLVNYIL